MKEIIVLIHGYGFDSRIWLPVELAFEGFQPVYLSLPGFGDEPAEEAYTIESLAKRFWERPEIKGAHAVHLAGHSMGGYVCLEMASQHPERVKSLALIHSHVYADPGEKKEARTATLEDIKKNGSDAFVRKMIPNLFPPAFAVREVVDLLIRRGLQFPDMAWYYGTQAMRDRKDQSATLQQLKVPVLMLMGEDDKAVPADLAYAQAPLAERTTLQVYPGVGHMAMYEHTAAMIGDLSAFYSLPDQ